jgi:hypothetical protein
MVFRNQESSQASVLLVVLFIFPGVIHLACMYLDIFLAIQQRDVHIENIKDTLRVGRRYVSMALVHLLVGNILMANIFAYRKFKYWVWGLLFVSILSLALLDARAAYVSLFIGGILLTVCLGVGRIWTSVKSLLKGNGLTNIVAVCTLMAVVTLGFKAGQSRWPVMIYSFKAAIHDVFDESSNTAIRPYVDQAYWSSDLRQCIVDYHPRCTLDQSAYLRMAWLLEGARSLVKHPFGIGYSDDYMNRLRGLSDNEKMYRHTDSFLIENIVYFGVVGILLYAALLWGVTWTLVRAVKEKHVTRVTLAVVALIIFVCAGRAMVDVLSLGLWRYFMALLGIYYGLLHSNMTRMRRE